MSNSPFFFFFFFFKTAIFVVVRKFECALVLKNVILKIYMFQKLELYARVQQ